MRPNPLYGVLTHLLNEPTFQLGNNSLPGITPIHDQSLESKPYYRLALPINPQSSQGLVLQEAHMSIYKQIDLSCATLGPVHFTATFMLDQSIYRMHLFLNNADKLALAPTWQMLTKDNGYVNVAPPKSIDYLAESIWQLGIPYLQLLRLQQKNIEKNLSKVYDDLEKTAETLSTSLPAKKTEYVASIDTILSHLTQLSSISSHSAWQRLSVHFKKVLQVVQRQTPQTRAAIHTQPRTQETNPTAKTRPSTKSNAPKKKKGSTSFFAQPAANDSAKKHIQELQELLLTINSTNQDTIKASCLAELNMQALRFDLTNKQSLTLTELNTLKKIDTDAANKARSLLQTYLIQENFPIVKLLSPFYELVNPDMLSLALKQKKAKLVAFLVEELRLPIDSYPINHQNKTYLNPIEYCYTKYDGTKAMQECFSALIASDASLLFPYPPENLPLAHVILSEKPRHPLYTCLEDNADKTLDNPAFFTHLINALRHRLKTSENAQEEEIKDWISHYKNLRTNAQYNRQENAATRVLRKNQLECIKAQTPAELVEKLDQDRDLFQQKAELQRKEFELRQKFDLYRRATGKNFPFRSYTELFAENLVLELFERQDDFAAIKESQKNYGRDFSQLIDYLMNLVDIEIELNKETRTKRKKTLATQKEMIFKEIEGLIRALPIIRDAEKYRRFEEEFAALKELLNQHKEAIYQATSDLENLYRKLAETRQQQQTAQQQIREKIEEFNYLSSQLTTPNSTIEALKIQLEQLQTQLEQRQTINEPPLSLTNVPTVLNTTLDTPDGLQEFSKACKREQNKAKIALKNIKNEAEIIRHSPFFKPGGKQLLLRQDNEEEENDITKTYEPSA